MASASRIGVTVVGGVTTIALARLLGPSGWAAFFVALSVVAVLLAATTLGVEHGIAYYVSSATWGPRAAFQSAVRVSACIGTLGAAAAVVVRLLVPSAFAGLSVWLTAVTAGALPFALILFYVSYIALATDRYEVAVSLPAVQAFLLLVLAVSAAALFGTEGAVIGSTIATVAVGAGAWMWGRRSLGIDRDAEPGQLRRAISFGIKGYAANALQFINYRLDLFILAAVASTSAVGSYSLAVSLTSLLWLLPRALSDVLFPRVARLSSDRDEDVREMVETKSLRHVSLVTILSVIVFIPSLELLVVPVFGEGFRSAVGLGLILLPGAAAIAVSTVLAATVVGRGKPLYSLTNAAIVTPLTVAAYAVLIPRFHSTGAAVVSTTSYIGTFLVWCVFYRRATGRRVAPLLWPTRSELDELLALVSARRR
jgi:O-antigen/teichoic acid export membrane protein